MSTKLRSGKMKASQMKPAELLQTTDSYIKTVVATPGKKAQERMLVSLRETLMTERAHLGVFSAASYISIGDNYGKKAESDPRLLGKQFSHFFPTSGIAGARPNNSMFDREHKWLYGGEK